MFESSSSPTAALSKKRNAPADMVDIPANSVTSRIVRTTPSSFEITATRLLCCFSNNLAKTTTSISAGSSAALIKCCFVAIFEVHCQNLESLLTLIPFTYSVFTNI